MKKKIMSGFFFHLKVFFCLVLEVCKHSVSSPDAEVTHIVQEEIPKLNYNHVKPVVGGLIRTLQFSLVMYV